MTRRKQVDIPITRRLLYSLLAIALLWFVSESFLLVRYWLQGPAGPKLEPVALYQAHPYRAFAPVPNVINRRRTSSWNSLGLRGPEASEEKSSGTIRILCVGGSTTLSIGATTDSRTYPARMGRLLREHYRDAPFRIEVLNGGVGAANSMETLIYFETRLLDLSPDIVIFHHAMNDAWMMLVFPGFQTDYTHGRCTFRIPPPKWWEWSPTLSFLLPGRSISNPYFRAENANLNAFIITRPEVLYNPRAVYNKPLVPEMFATFERNVRNFITVARANGVIPVLSTQVYHDDRAGWGLMFITVSRFNDMLRDLARRESLGLVDFAKKVSWNKKQFLDDCHMKDTDDGLGTKARIFADSLIKLKVVEQAYRRRIAASGPPRGR